MPLAELISYMARMRDADRLDWYTSEDVDALQQQVWEAENGPVDHSA
jgi:hypothetical protein